MLLWWLSIVMTMISNIFLFLQNRQLRQQNAALSLLVRELTQRLAHGFRSPS